MTRKPHRYFRLAILVLLSATAAGSAPAVAQPDTTRQGTIPAPLNTMASTAASDELRWIMVDDSSGFPSFVRPGDTTGQFITYTVTNNPGNNLWYPYPGIPGFNGPVYAVASCGDEIYIGGQFTQAGGISANNIVKWNAVTNEWSALDRGVNGPVFTIAVTHDTVYVGGGFIRAGEFAANYIAYWDASAQRWTELGYGMNHWVYAIALDTRGYVYAGGLFTLAGNQSASHVARWNGSRWSPVGGGVNKWVYALAVWGDNLYAGGGFTQAGSTWANHVAQFSMKTRMWEPMGGGTDDAVYALAADTVGDVYAGGQFNSADSVYANNIAKWNSNNRTWSGLPVGILQSAPVPVFISSIAIDSRYLYVGGRFYTTDSMSAYPNYFAAWNGSRWRNFGDGVNAEVFTISPTPHGVFLGGRFGMAGGRNSFGIGCIHPEDEQGGQVRTKGKDQE